MAIFSFLLTSCMVPALLAKSTHQPHHFKDGKGSIEHGKSGEKLTFAYLEFDDQGQLWRSPYPENQSDRTESTQLESLLKELKLQVSKGPVRTIIYIHGWNDNAGTRGSLKKFQSSLKEIAKVSNKPVFGVHVGWRGRVMKFPIFIDIASREAAADRIGRASMVASLRAISAASHRNPRSTVTMVGHSFGARILDQAACAILADQIGKSLGSSSGNQMEDFKPAADTIILANTAESASLPLQIVNLMRDNGIRYTNSKNGRDLPLVVAITSSADKATGQLLPYWNRIAKRVLGLPNKSGRSSSPLQHDAMTRAMGFYPPLHSHVLMEGRNGETPANGKKVKWSANMCSWEELLKENNRLGKRVPLATGSNPVELWLSLTPDGNLYNYNEYNIRQITQKDFEANLNKGIFKKKREIPRNQTPFWFLQVPPFVCSGHGDLWNPNFTGLVTAVEAMNRPVGTVSGKASVHGIESNTSLTPPPPE
ncbi:MAG: hypothetical protein EOO09_22390 [Chitinophagaceae bacterium]|nr:MAG: hypothetical protein EOO09_22390 [Chitinophagaceae bacterium]